MHKGTTAFTTPPINNVPIHLFSYCQEKGNFFIFLIFVYNLVMLHLDFTNYDVWMADYIINLWNLFRMFWNLNAISYFRLNRMSRSRKALWSSGISRMVSWYTCTETEIYVDNSLKQFNALNYSHIRAIEKSIAFAFVNFQNVCK